MIPFTRAVSLVNARVVTPRGIASSVRFRSRVVALDEPPGRRDAVLDLEGAFVLPGLINAHDHLELNHYGLLKRRERYANAADWIDDLRPFIRGDAVVRGQAALPLRARLLAGALKNVLAGVTLVAHHNPRYRELRGRLPLRVLDRYGWAHSFALERQPVGANGEPGGDVRARCQATPPDQPFIVHAAEGLDDRARAELPRLEALGCVRPNTVLVHGVALSVADWSRLEGCGGSLVWCPASNRFLFGETAAVPAFLRASAGPLPRIALGSDSRVTGARDLLDELRAGADSGISAASLLTMVTHAAARVLRVGDAGRIEVGLPADLAVVPPLAPDAARALLAVRRRDLLAVVVGGQPVVASFKLTRLFGARAVPTASMRVDGVERVAAAGLVRALRHSPVVEPGVHV